MEKINVQEMPRETETPIEQTNEIGSLSTKTLKEIKKICYEFPLYSEIRKKALEKWLDKAETSEEVKKIRHVSLPGSRIENISTPHGSAFPNSIFVPGINSNLFP